MANSNFYMKKASSAFIKSLDDEFEKRKNEILNTKSEYYPGEHGRAYCFSNSEGDDENSGLGEGMPLKTISRLMQMQNDDIIKPGDIVLFKRGDEWHEKLITKEGVTYSAYDKGPKPRILGSIEADRADDWELVPGTENLYRFREEIVSERDVGNIVLNEGEGYCLRILKEVDADRSVRIGDDCLVSNGYSYWKLPPRKFKDQYDLIEIGDDIPESDLMYYHNLDEGALYVYSKKGNPGDLFESVEICTKGNLIAAKSDVVIDNLCLKYTGSHGVGAGTCKNLTVRNCEIGWIGGSIQFVTKDKEIVRFGNSVEIFGGCDGYYVYNNYMYEAIDCGPTIQWQGTLPAGKTIVEKNIEIHDNVLSAAKPEIWLTTAKENTEDTYAYMENCRVYNNLVRDDGYGFSGYFHQKTGYTAFYGAAKTYAPFNDCYFENNKFWHIRRQVFVASNISTIQGKGFNWRNNVIVHPYGKLFGSAGGFTGAGAMYYDNETVAASVKDKMFGENEFMYTLEEGQKDPADE